MPTPPSDDADAHWFETPLRVRYAETDKMGVVYYGNYFTWFEVGRTDVCRQCGFIYREMEIERDAYLMVVGAECRYRRPARYDDDLLIKTRIGAMGRRTMRFDYQIVDEASRTLIAEGSTSHVVTNAEGRPRAFPEREAALLKARLSDAPPAATVTGTNVDRPKPGDLT